MVYGLFPSPQPHRKPDPEHTSRDEPYHEFPYDHVSPFPLRKLSLHGVGYGHAVGLYNGVRRNFIDRIRKELVLVGRPLLVYI